jgi:Mce-associated membrane protein
MSGVVAAEDTGRAPVEDLLTSPADETSPDNGDLGGSAAPSEAPRRWMRVLVIGLLPGLALCLAMFGGYLKWIQMSAHEAQAARAESVQAATEGSIALLSYSAESVESDLGAARERLTGSFKDSYSSLIDDVVIPGSKERLISADASVVAAAPVSATETHANALLFINQTVHVGKDAPTTTASSVKVSLEKVGGRWLISGFEPV